MNWKQLPFERGSIHSFKPGAEGLSRAACGGFFNLRFSKNPKQQADRYCERCCKGMEAAQQ